MTKPKSSYRNRPSHDLIPVSNVLDSVKENLGIDDNIKLNALRDIWPIITSFDIANKSHIAYFDKEGNLVITTSSSTLATELSMQKSEILEKLKIAANEAKIYFKDIRFIHRQKSSNAQN